jgi:hypothetical protein
MYLHFNNQIYLAYYNDDIICLDTKRDKYIIFNNQLKEVINFLLGYPVEYANKQYSYKYKNLDMSIIEFDTIIKELIGVKILKNKLFTLKDNRSVSKKNSQGAFSYDWHYDDKLYRPSFKKIFICWWMLLKARLLFQFGGFHYVLKKISKNKPHSLRKVSQAEIDDLINNLDYACLYFPTKTKCLEWAVTYIFLAYRAQFGCDLAIGVQTMPFFAHAWVEINGQALTNSAEVAKDVVTIFSTAL